MDIEPYEQEALIFAGQMLGEYLDEIGVTDIAKLTPHQWQTMLEVVCMNFLLKRANLQPCPF